MPSCDVVSEVDIHEVTNAVDQANREVQNRFDFKNTGAAYALTDGAIGMKAPNEFQLTQMLDILTGKLAKRSIDIACLKVNTPETNLKEARQSLTVQQGIETATAKKIVKSIKDQKMKVQASIQGEKVRVTGKKRDDLQEVIAFLKEEKLGLPVQFDNFRD